MARFPGLIPLPILPSPVSPSAQLSGFESPTAMVYKAVIFDMYVATPSGEVYMAAS